VTAALLAIAGTSLIGAQAAAASPAPPTAIHVAGGAESWRPDPSFSVYWDNPPASPAVVATHYRLAWPEGGTIEEERLPGALESLAIEVPGFPGAYEVEVWLEDGEGSQGPPVSAQLRYDRTRPGASSAEAPPEWLGRTAFPLIVRLQHPEGVPPVSGILGYAVSINRDAEGTPCGDGLLCTTQETDLQSGIGGDWIEIPLLPEGKDYVHSLAVSRSHVHSAEVGHRLYRVDLTDPETVLEGLPPGWVNRSVELTARANDAASGMGSGGAFTAIRVDDGAPVTSAGDAARTTVIAEGVHTVAFYARDAAGNLNDGAAENSERNKPPATAPLRIDRTPPRVAFSNSQSPQDPELIRAGVADALSGASMVAGSIGVRPAGSGDAFQALPTDRSSSGLSAHWDPAAYPEGDYEFRAVAADAAGNYATSSARANGTPMVLSNPLTATTVLEAGLGRRSATKRVARFGRRVRFGGRLTTGTRRPIAGVEVRVVERYAGSRDERVVRVVTGTRGEFSLPLPAGPSREVLASYAGSVALAHAAARPAELLVRSGVALHVSAAVARVGGAPIVFRGTVRSAAGELPEDGKAVELEFRAAGLPWEEFRTVRTNRRGRFRYAYRFSDDDSRGVTFQFRAHAPAERGWPYEPGSSRPVRVRGR
jgi:hypothetical protein